MSFPIHQEAGYKGIDYQEPEVAFSADGSKFAMAMDGGRVSVWDIQSKTLLQTSMKVPKSNHVDWRVDFLQFSGGNLGRNLGKEALVFVRVCLMFTF